MMSVTIQPALPTIITPNPFSINLNCMWHYRYSKFQFIMCMPRAHPLGSLLLRVTHQPWQTSQEPDCALWFAETESSDSCMTCQKRAQMSPWPFVTYISYISHREEEGAD